MKVGKDQRDYLMLYCFSPLVVYLLGDILGLSPAAGITSEAYVDHSPPETYDGSKRPTSPPPQSPSPTPSSPPSPPLLPPPRPPLAQTDKS